MLVIFSRLAISAPDRAWIEAIRQQHDPQHRLIEAHVTFVFPFDGVPAGDVVAHAAAVAATTARIPFRLSKAAVVKDPLGPASHLFLLPTEGAEAMLSLHARLYSGILSAHRNPTIAFAPHVTVGAFDTQEAAAEACATLPVFDILGSLGSLIVAEFDGRTVAAQQELSFRA